MAYRISRSFSERKADVKIEVLLSSEGTKELGALLVLDVDSSYT